MLWFAICIFTISTVQSTFAQVDSINIIPPIPTLFDSTKTDTLITQINKTDSLLQIKVKSKSGLDTIVNYSSKDTAVFYLKTRMMRLRGNSKLSYKQQTLEAEVIELNFNNSQLYANGVRDSNNRLIGYPKFTDKGEIFYGESMAFNFKTNKGVITVGETAISDGYYSGDKIKRITENELFVQNGCYTTCDKPHPHFYFGSPQMKVAVGDKIYIDPIIFYVEDLPVFALPFGLFFSQQSGRKSGLILPAFFFSGNRGVTLENLGVYLALSDYYDTKFSVDFYSKGGFNLKNFTQWKYQDMLSGSFRFEYGKSRFNPNEGFSKNWLFALNHNQSISPQEQAVVNLNFSSNDRNRNTQWDQTQRVVQEISSNASYSKSFDNGSSLSLAYGRSQNIITSTYSQSPSLSFNLPQWYPLKSSVSSDSWLRELSISYSGNANYNDSKIITVNNFVVSPDSVRKDTSFSNIWSGKITHSPRISFILPKLSYFTFTPYISFGLNNYVRRSTNYRDMTDSTIKSDVEYGFFSEYTYSAGISMSTRLFGMMKPNLFGIKAIRHTFQPNFSFSFRPDQSSPKDGFYGEYYDSLSQQNVKYSRYEKDGGGLASSYLSGAINYSFVNSISIKLNQADTVEEKPIDILGFTISGYYDLVKKFRKLSDASLSFHTASIAGFNINGGTSFNFYEEEVKSNYLGRDSIVLTDRYLIAAGKGLARMTNFNLNLSTGFSSETGFGGGIGQTDAKKKDSIGLGERFSKKINYSEEFFDFFGDESPGYSPLKLPWSVGLNLMYNYSMPNIRQKSQSLTLGTNLTLNLTPTWFISGALQIDLITKQIVSPVITVKKDLHCWELNFTWYPIGYNQGFFLHFGIKSPQLRDLKYEERNSDFF